MLRRDHQLVRISEMPTRYKVTCTQHETIAVEMSWQEALEEQDRHIREKHIVEERSEQQVKPNER